MEAEKTLATYFISLQPGAVRDFTPKAGTRPAKNPRIIFDSIDSGVANPVGDAGTFLDEVWAGAPFTSKGDFTARVATVSERWRDNGHFTETEHDKVVATVPNRTWRSSLGAHRRNATGSGDAP